MTTGTAYNIKRVQTIILHSVEADVVLVASVARFAGPKPRMMQRQKGHTAVLSEKRSIISCAQPAAAHKQAGRQAATCSWLDNWLAQQNR